MLDLKRLQYLETVYQYKSFTRASEELFVTQPTISSAIASLEKELNIKLITRNTKTVSFTPAGELFVRRASRLLKESSDLEAEMNDISKNNESFLRLGLPSLTNQHILQSLFQDFLISHQNVRLILDIGPMNEQIEKVLNGNLDLAYNAIPISYDDDIIIIPHLEAEVCAFMRADHPLASYNPLPISALNNSNIVMTDIRSKIYHLVTKACEEKDIHPNMIIQHDQMLSLMGIVEAGNYVGFVSTVQGQKPYGFDKFVVRSLDIPLVYNLGFIRNRKKYTPKIALDLIKYFTTRNTK